MQGVVENRDSDADDKRHDGGGLSVSMENFFKLRTNILQLVKGRSI